MWLYGEVWGGFYTTRWLPDDYNGTLEEDWRYLYKNGSTTVDFDFPGNFGFGPGGDFFPQNNTIRFCLTLYKGSHIIFDWDFGDGKNASQEDIYWSV